MLRDKNPRPMKVQTLTDGGQRAEDVARTVSEFVRGASASLELALYDVRLPGRGRGDGRRRAARGGGARGRDAAALQRRLEPARRAAPAAGHPSRHSRRAAARCPAGPGDPGPDAPQVRRSRPRGGARPVRRTGRSIPGPGRRTCSWRSSPTPLAGAYAGQLRGALGARDVERSGRVEPRVVELAGGVTARAWFTPGHGAALSQAIATAIGAARRRVRIASPVITSAPILGHPRRARAEREGSTSPG